MSNRKLHIVNPSEKSHFDGHNFILWFGAYGDTYLLVYAALLEDALELAVDWLVDNAPGLLATDEVNEEYERLIAEGKSEDEAREEAEMDATMFGHNGCEYINSWEWGIALENPTPKQISMFVKGQ